MQHSTRHPLPGRAAHPRTGSSRRRLIPRRDVVWTVLGVIVMSWLVWPVLSKPLTPLEAYLGLLALLLLAFAGLAGALHVALGPDPDLEGPWDPREPIRWTRR